MERSAIALVGFMGAGKSTVGRALAARSGTRFVDLDEAFVQRHGAIPDLFRTAGEARFRELEREVLLDHLDGVGVLALGGGTLLDPRSRVEVESRFHTVWLDVPLEVAAARVGSTSDGAPGRPAWTDVAARHAARRPIYASARSRVDATGPVEAVVDAILACRGDRVERVDLGDRAYDVVLARGFGGLGERLAGREVRVVTDDRVGPLWSDALLAEVQGPVVSFAAGEAHKTLDTWRAVVDALIAARTPRSAAVVALGGGVVGDLAGFAAASVNRGVPFVQVPTTTLAMVDSSVGGKTGVNHARGKNLVGAFHQPELVWMHLGTLATLDPRERRAGLAEVLKTGALLDPVLLDVLEAGADALRRGEPGPTEHVVALAVRAKARVVAADEREAGLRRVLNAGHTVGHALERAATYGSLLHGEAVAIGLVAEARYAARLGVCEPGFPDRIERIARALGLPVTVPADLDRETIRDAMTVDKKVSRDILYLPVPTSAGEHAIVSLPFHHLIDLLPEPR
ncbi:MAG: 3-dehydroquinate synthase [Myxococcota bacterium]